MPIALSAVLHEWARPRGHFVAVDYAAETGDTVGAAQVINGIREPLP